MYLKNVSFKFDHTYTMCQSKCEDGPIKIEWKLLEIEASKVNEWMTLQNDAVN